MSNKEAEVVNSQDDYLNIPVLPKLPTGEPQPNNLFMVNNNLLTNISLEEITMGININTTLTINELETNLNNLEVHSKALDVQMEERLKVKEALNEQVNNLKLRKELENKIAIVKEEIELKEQSLKELNCEINSLEEIVNGNISISAVEEIEETPKLVKAEDVVGQPPLASEELTKKQKARRAKHQAHVEAHVAHVEEQQTRERIEAIEETIADPEGLQQVAKTLDEVFSNSPDEETNTGKFNKLYPSIVLPALPIYPSSFINDVIISNKEHIGQGKYNLVKAVLELLESSLLITSKETLIKFVENYELEF